MNSSVPFQPQLFYGSVKCFALVFSKLNGLGLIFLSQNERGQTETAYKATVAILFGLNKNILQNLGIFLLILLNFLHSNLCF